MPEPGAAAEPLERLLSALEDDGTLLVTSSRRLARHVRGRYDRRMLAAGRAAWPTAAVQFWRDWLERLLDEAVAGGMPRRLAASAADALWEQLAARHCDPAMLATRGFARQAAQAWRLLHDWCVSPEEVLRRARTREEKAFATILDAYRRALDRRRRIDPAERPAAALRLAATEATALPRRVLLAGFDRRPPVVESLVDVLERRGVRVETVAAPPAANRPRLLSYADEDAELRAAGRWARERLLERPDARVAIVVSELEQDAPRVERLVREGFAPGWQDAPAAWQASVESSYGRRLAEYPAVAAALQCLRLAAAGLGSAEVSTLLRSALVAPDPPGPRALLDRRFRRLPDRRWRPEALSRALRSLDTGAEHAAPAWFDALRQLAALGGRRRQAASAWAEEFGGLLAAIGWPGTAPLSSEDFQLVNRWRQLLNELAGLDQVLAPLPLAAAVGRLSSLAAEALYQPERPDSRVPVLGPLEAAGMGFDHLRVLRCDAERWPAAAQPLPLVSRALQVEHGMPDSTPADALAHSRRVLERLAGSAPDVVLSYSRSDLDAVRLPSPLLAELEATPAPPDPDPGWYANGLVDPDGLRPAADPVPAVTGREAVAGGARILELQKREPFSAFATGRLAVRELDAFEPGLTASRRGNLLHDALRRLYAGRPSRADIAAWPPAGRRRRIRDAAGGALERLERQADGVLARLLDFERERIERLLDEVLRWDLGRRDFVIVGVEERLPFEHAGVSLELRADRIDRLGDGRLLIVDYKTGRPRSLLGRDGEPLDLQLAVYAAAVDSPLGGLALLNVHPHAVSPSAVGAGIEWKPVDDTTWRDTLRRWRAVVHRAMEQIALGDVRVNLRGDAGRRRQLDLLARAAELRRGD